MENLREWTMSLSSNVRSDLLELVYTIESRGVSGGQLTRSDYFTMMSTAWQLLYTPDWPLLHIPDLQSLVQMRQDIKTDSPSALEDVERVLRRLGIVPSSMPPTYYVTPVSHLK